jgi:hypothetical protein
MCHADVIEPFSFGLGRTARQAANAAASDMIAARIETIKVAIPIRSFRFLNPWRSARRSRPHDYQRGESLDILVPATDLRVRRLPADAGRRWAAWAAVEAGRAGGCG